MAHRMYFFRKRFINDIENTKDNTIREGEVTMANEQNKISLDRFAKLSNCQVYNNGTKDKPDFKFYDMDGNENIIMDIRDVATGLVCSNRDDLNQVFKIEEKNCDKLKGLYNTINKPNIQPYLQDPDKYPGVLDSIENLSGYPQGSITLMNNLCKDDAFKEKVEITLQVDEWLDSPKQEALQKLNDYFEIDVLEEKKKVDMSFMKDILDKPENQLFNYDADGIEAAMEYVNLQAQYDDAIYTSAKYVRDMPLEFEQTIKTDMSMLQNENNKLRDDLLFQSINKESVDKTMNLLQDRILENNAKLLALELERRLEALEKLQNVSPDNRSLFKIISDDVKRDVKNGIDFAKNAIETTSNAIRNGVGKVNDAVKEGINQIKNFAKECIDKGLKAVGEKVQQIQNTVDNVKTACTNVAKTVKETVKGLPDKVKAFAGKLKDKAMEAKETVKQAYAEHLKEKKENIDKKLEKMGYDK